MTNGVEALAVDSRADRSGRIAGCPTVLPPGAMLYCVARAPIAPGELATALRKAGVVRQRSAA